jgi:hypothetical protein
MVEQSEDRAQYVTNDIFLTLEETADILDVPPSTVRGWVITGKLPPSPASPQGELQFRMDAVIAFILKQIAGATLMEQPQDEKDDNEKSYSLRLEGLPTIFGAHVDEARTPVGKELLPYVYKYTESCGNPRPDSRFREEDFHLLL